MNRLSSRGPVRTVAIAVAALLVPIAVVAMVGDGASGVGRRAAPAASARDAAQTPPASVGGYHRGPRCWVRPAARWCSRGAAAPTPTTVAPPEEEAAAAPSYRPGTHPNPATTGVPAGWTPAGVHEGDLWVYDAGTVIEDLLITGDLQIRATGVTVRRTRVMGIIWNQWDDDEQFGGLLIEDVEVGPDSGILNWGHGSVGTAGYTARRVEIHNVTDGFRVSGDDIVIEDSFVKLSVREGECNHLDGVQGYGGGRNVTIRHNTIDARGNCGNAAVFFGDSSPEADVQENILMGGAFSLRLHQVEVPTVFVARNNHVVNGEYDYGPLYFVDAGALNLVCEGNDLVTIDANYQITGVVGEAPCSIDDRR